MWILAAASLFLAVVVANTLFRVAAKVDRLRRRVQDSSDASDKLVEQTARDLSVIRNSIRKSKGETVFTAQSTMKEVLASDPRVSRLMVKHRRSGIIRMEFDPARTLEETARAYDVDLDPLLKDLNQLD